jgi:hypothetical protein
MSNRLLVAVGGLFHEIVLLLLQTLVPWTINNSTHRPIPLPPDENYSLNASCTLNYIYTFYYNYYDLFFVNVFMITDDLHLTWP